MFCNWGRWMERCNIYRLSEWRKSKLQTPAMLGVHVHVPPDSTPGKSIQAPAHASAYVWPRSPPYIFPQFFLDYTTAAMATGLFATLAVHGGKESTIADHGQSAKLLFTPNLQIHDTCYISPKRRGFWSNARRGEAVKPLGLDRSFSFTPCRVIGLE